MMLRIIRNDMKMIIGQVKNTKLVHLNRSGMIYFWVQVKSFIKTDRDWNVSSLWMYLSRFLFSLGFLFALDSLGLFYSIAK
jgi:hypothetical protein